MDPIAFAQRLCRKLGLEVRRFAPEASITATLAGVCRSRGIDLVLDVGASVGQFAGDLRASGYAGRILSFEPLPDAWARLERSARRDPLWQVHPRCAIGAASGEATINVAANSVSSSILPMLDAHLRSAPESAYAGTVTAPLARLDDAARPALTRSTAPLLKIDTQGYEWPVLDGAEGILPSIEAISLELSVVPLYGGQRLWSDVIDRLASAGFTLWSLHPGFADRHTGRVLQFDGVFCRDRGT